MTQEKNKLDIEKNKNVAALSYLWILFLVPLLNNKSSKFAQFHARQGMILFLLSLFTFVPIFGQILFIVLVAVSVLGLLKTLNGEWYKIPYIYDWSKKFNI